MLKGKAYYSEQEEEEKSTSTTAVGLWPTEQNYQNEKQHN